MTVERSMLLGGMILVLLGLAAGMFIPALTNPRMGLSAHLVGVQAGMLLVVVSLAWRHIGLSRRSGRLVRVFLFYAGYAIWLSSLLAALWGTSKSTPIAGAGFSGARWQEFVVAAGLVTGSLAALAAFGTIVLVLLRARSKE